MQLPTVGFEPWSSHTAVRHVTARPLHTDRQDSPSKSQSILKLRNNTEHENMPTCNTQSPGMLMRPVYDEAEVEAEAR